MRCNDAERVLYMVSSPVATEETVFVVVAEIYCTARLSMVINENGNTLVEEADAVSFAESGAVFDLGTISTRAPENNNNAPMETTITASAITAGVYANFFFGSCLRDASFLFPDKNSLVFSATSRDLLENDSLRDGGIISSMLRDICMYYYVISITSVAYDGKCISPRAPCMAPGGICTSHRKLIIAVSHIKPKWKEMGHREILFYRLPMKKTVLHQVV